MSRGRKSAASLVVVPLVPGQGRPEPPAELDTLEQRVWREVIAALPAHRPSGVSAIRRCSQKCLLSQRRKARDCAREGSVTISPAPEHWRGANARKRFMKIGRGEVSPLSLAHVRDK